MARYLDIFVAGGCPVHSKMLIDTLMSAHYMLVAPSLSCDNQTCLYIAHVLWVQSHPWLRIIVSLYPYHLSIKEAYN